MTPPFKSIICCFGKLVAYILEDIDRLQKISFIILHSVGSSRSMSCGVIFNMNFSWKSCYFFKTFCFMKCQTHILRQVIFSDITNFVSFVVIFWNLNFVGLDTIFSKCLIMISFILLKFLTSLYPYTFLKLNIALPRYLNVGIWQSLATFFIVSCFHFPSLKSFLKTHSSPRSCAVLRLFLSLF